MHSRITFYGGVGAVTGSNFLFESGDIRLLVDCGLHQGLPEEEAKNWEAFPYDPKSISHLIVTHAHIDHIGRIPKLVREGFRGSIISTEATKALAGPMLRDALELLTHEAEVRHRKPLFEKDDIEAAMRLWQGVYYRQPQNLQSDVTFELLNASHILGSAMVRFSRGGRSLIFTGDLGGTSVLLPPRDSIAGVHYLVMESVYGDRTRTVHEEYRREELKRVVLQNAERGGRLLIPAFSTERTQEIIFELRTIFTASPLAQVPVYIDSPLAEEITQAFIAYPQYFKPSIAEELTQGKNIFSFPQMHFVADAAASGALAKKPGPLVIVAASGMSAGGRVVQHERTVLPDEHAVLLIVGYQAAGTLGRRLIDGAHTVEIREEQIPVRCRIETNFAYSAHLDGPHLVEVTHEAVQTLERVFVVMGEPASSAFLAERLHEHLGLEAEVPVAGASVEIEL